MPYIFLLLIFLLSLLTNSCALSLQATMCSPMRLFLSHILAYLQQFIHGGVLKSVKLYILNNFVLNNLV